MTSRPRVELHPEAVEEAAAAKSWYDERDATAGDAFTRELKRAITKIRAAPASWPKFDSSTHKVSLRRFPFFVAYRIHAGAIQVLAVAHAYRKPGYWRSRRAR